MLSSYMALLSPSITHWNGQYSAPHTQREKLMKERVLVDAKLYRVFFLGIPVTLSNTIPPCRQHPLRKGNSQMDRSVLSQKFLTFKEPRADSKESIPQPI